MREVFGGVSQCVSILTSFICYSECSIVARVIEYRISAMSTSVLISIATFGVIGCAILAARGFRGRVDSECGSCSCGGGVGGRVMTFLCWMYCCMCVQLLA